jgi:ketosteroid isomerase-like protein
MTAGSAGCAGRSDAPAVPASQDATTVAAVLDDFHDAAARADAPRYFAHFAPEGVFIGTDPKERWTADEFRAFAEPYFSQGKGWTYRPTSRHISIAPSGGSRVVR